MEAQRNQALEQRIEALVGALSRPFEEPCRRLWMSGDEVPSSQQLARLRERQRGGQTPERFFRNRLDHRRTLFKLCDDERRGSWRSDSRERAKRFAASAL